MRRGWAPVLRIARRDAWRARGRSALILVMVALPVFALSFGAVLFRTGELDLDEELTRALGQTSYSVRAVAPETDILTQTPQGQVGGFSYEEDGAPADVTALVPAGTQVLTEASTDVTLETATGVGRAAWTETPAADPAFAGRWVLESGRAPTAEEEVLLTPALAERVGAGAGDSVVLTDPAATVTVVGTVRSLEAGRDRQSVVAPPGTLAAVTGDDTYRLEPQELWAVDAPMAWDGVLALNERGVVVLSRAVALDPPPRSEVPYYAAQDAFGSSPGLAGVLVMVIGAALVVSLAALEVMLLAGAAFAVGTRRQSRALALVAAAGGDRRDIRRVVLAGGLVLGAAAGLVGVAAGVLAALAASPFLWHLTGTDPGRFDLRPLELAPIALLGVVTGVLAAVFPARAAARQDVVAVLGGRRGEVRTRRRVPVAGLALFGLGVAASVVGSAWALALATGGEVESTSTTYVVAALIAGGAGLVVIGLVVLSPAVVGLAGRLARWLPLAPRLALRDATRHRSRTAPAVAAVLVAVSGSVALTMVVASDEDSNRRSYTAQLPDGYAAVDLSTYRTMPDGSGELEYASADLVAAAVSAHLPVVEAQALDATARCFDESCAQVSPVPPEENSCPLWDEPGPYPNEQEAAMADDWRCTSGVELASFQALGGNDPVADAATLESIAGTELPAEAVQVLDSGGIVTSWRALVLDGTAQFEQFAPGAFEQPSDAVDDGGDPEPTEVVDLPAVWVEDLPFTTVLSPGAADELGMDVVTGALVLRLDRLPTQAEEDAAAAALETVGLESYALVVERGYVSDFTAGLVALVVASAVITLGAAGIATGLAQADARADHATLSAIGAAPRIRRGLAGAQALTITVLGTGLGVAAGLVPGIAFIAAVGRWELVWPWPSLLTIVVVVPVLAGAAAWLCTRSRLPLTRREAL